MDQDFISGKFLDCEFPQNKRFLLKYFRSAFQRQFARYYLIFRSYDHFIDHTGLRTTKSDLKFLKNRFDMLEQAYTKARLDGDIERIAEIESGGFPLY